MLLCGAVSVQMNEEFARQVLRKVVGRVCQPLGVHGMQSTVCETMTDVLKSYLLTLAKTTSSYCLHGESQLTLNVCYRCIKASIH